MPFRVGSVDHIEMFVPDRREAAAWFQRVLGLELGDELREWAELPGYPCVISSDGGHTKLAMFEGQPPGTRPTAGHHLVAFRVTAEGFVEFLSRLDTLDLHDHRGWSVTPSLVTDHEKAYSIYFSDPYGHRLEIATYEYEATRAALQELGIVDS